MPVMTEPAESAALPRPDTYAHQLLEAVAAHIREQGLADTSLRRLAAAAGTSDRMLRYHFGTREGLLAAVAGLLRRHESVDLMPPGTTRREAMTATWEYYTDPNHQIIMRIFFHLAGLAVDQRHDESPFLDRVVAAWTDQMTALGVAQGLPQERAADEARLLVAGGRGLFLDLLLTRDVDAVARAYRLMLDRVLGPDEE